MRRAVSLLLICIGFMTAAKHQSAAQQQPLTEEEAFQLGVEAYIYGYPLVMDSVRRVTTNVAAPQGKLAPMGEFANYRSSPDASKRDLAGSNVDTLYSLAWLDLRGVPMSCTFRTHTAVSI